MDIISKQYPITATILVIANKQYPDIVPNPSIIMEVKSRQ